MRKKDVEIGAVYKAKVSGSLTEVRIMEESRYGNGWRALNLRTGRSVHIKSAAKLREKVN